jgi:predicted nuclease of predicted toxin-antitoxin system
MLRYLFDEHIPLLIADFLREQESSSEIVQANYRFPGLSDPELLEWATENDYILVSQDINTLIGFAYKRIENNIPTSGVFILRSFASYRAMLEDLLAAMLLSESSEWKDQVTYLPFNVETK